MSWKPEMGWPLFVFAALLWLSIGFAILIGNDENPGLLVDEEAEEIAHEIPQPRKRPRSGSAEIRTGPEPTASGD